MREIITDGDYRIFQLILIVTSITLQTMNLPLTINFHCYQLLKIARINTTNIFESSFRQKIVVGATSETSSPRSLEVNYLSKQEFVKMNKSYKLKKDAVLMITVLIATLRCCSSSNIVDTLEDPRSNSVDREYHTVTLGTSS